MRLTALIAAYALALHAIVAACVPLPLDIAAHPQTFCLSGESNGDHSVPLPHEPCLGCLAGVCHAALGLDVTVAVFAPAIAAAFMTMPLPQRTLRQTSRTLHFARAPPAA